jgi:hypothetical protein
MERLANRRNSRVITRSKLIIWASLSLTLIGLCRLPEVVAEDLKSASSQFAEQSFALLDRLSKQGGNNSNPALGPVANFAGDADGLRQSLARSDLRSARYHVALLQTDASAVDQALKQHPNSALAAQWRVLREQAEQLAHEIPPCVSPSACSSPPATPTESGSVSVTNADGYAPRIVITSRESVGGFLRLKGYVDGRALKSAGIYQGSSQLKALKVVDTPGRQRVEFDLRFEEPSPATILRVADADGRTTQAPIADPSLPPSPLPSAPEISPDSEAPIASSGEPQPNLGQDASTAEIPSHGPVIPSPSKRHTLGSKLGDVQINIQTVRRTGNLPPTYEIIGQIAGRGITRAGIYLNGRLLQSIPITSSARFTSFDQRVVARGGSTTIRAYSVGNQSIEQPVDLSEAGDAAFFYPGGNRDN